jgi:outer membrane protein insertion porin family
LAACCGTLLTAQALGQDQPELPPGEAPAAYTIPPELEPYEGRPVRAVRLEYPRPTPTPAKPPPDEQTGDANVQAPPARMDAELEQLIRNQLRLKDGMPFEAKLVSEDVSRLNRLGRFRSVEARVDMNGDGSVDLVYVLGLQPIVADVQTVGNREISDQDLGKYIDVLVGTPVDPTRLDRACRAIEAAYREKGYYNCLVTVDQKELDLNGNVYFKVREGEKTKVTEVRFEGNVSFTSRELRGDLKTKPAWLLDKGRLENDVLAEDVATLISFYRDRGYIDARADRLVTPSPDGKEAIVTFIIDEGALYTLRDVAVVFIGPEGERVFTIEQLIGLMRIKPGDVFSERNMRRSLEAIKDAYGKMGFVNAAVNRRERRDLSNPLVDVVLVITEGRQFTTGEVIIRGDTLTKSDIIRREVRVLPERPLDTTEIAETQRRLERTNLFAPRSVKVTIQPERPEDPGMRDVLVQVEETNTGRFAVGGSVASDSGLSASISIAQRNFDVTDTPDTFGEGFSGEAFRGGGQTFSINAVPGTERQLYSISLSDPHVFESDYSGSAQGFYATRVYSAYDESRWGGRFGVGRRMGSRWVANIPFRIETIGLSDIAEDAPQDYYDVAEDSLLVGLGLKLSRTSVDDMTFPSKGNKIEVGIEQVTGDYTYTILTGEYSVYQQLSEDAFGRKTTLQLTTKAGYIPQSFDEVPFYERFYLGGQSFRGFDYRAVAPVGPEHDNPSVDSSYTVGGNWMFFFGAEVKQPLYEDMLWGVVFADTGTVQEDVGFDEYRVSLGFGFRLLVRQLSPVPLAFDFGFPIVKQESDEERLFTFSVDVPFN